MNVSRNNFAMRSIKVITRDGSLMRHSRPGRRCLAPQQLQKSALAGESGLVNGRELSGKLRHAIRQGVQSLKELTGYAPCLAVVRLGPQAAADKLRRQLFAAAPGEASWFDKEHGAKDVGMDFILNELPSHAPVERVKQELRRLSRRKRVHGVMLELPVPPHLRPHLQELWNCIDPEKDVDGMHTRNAGRLMDMASGFPDIHDEDSSPPPLHAQLPTNLPTTPLGVMEYLDACALAVRPGMHCVVIGRSRLVGLPMAALLLSRRASVTVLHSQTPKQELLAQCQRADIIVAAAGVPGMIKAEFVKPTTVVVNVGTTFVPEKQELLPDVDSGVAQVARVVTPTPTIDHSSGHVTPSGVGPMTLPLLLHSTLVNAIHQARKEQKKVVHKREHGCRKDTPALTEAELNAAMQGPGGLAARGWVVGRCPETGAQIMSKTWTVLDFEEAVRLINDMKDLAEAANHHPTFHLTEYRHLKVDLSSAAIKCLSRFDLDLAKAYDELSFEPYSA